MELEKRGIPTVVVCGRGFERPARSYARAYRFPSIRLSLVDDLIAHQGLDELRESARASVEGILREWQAADGNGGAADEAGAAADSILLVEGGFLEANRELLERGLTDGLPVVPPTPELVGRFVEASGRRGEEVVARLMPRSAEITVERIAANAVMAGCAPGAMPILLAAVRAMEDEAYSVNHVVTTAHTMAPLLVVSGPIAKEVGMSDGRDITAKGWRANATLARAVRLVLYNCAADLESRGATTQGHLGKIADAITENVEQSPWEPLHVELGYRESDSAVTVFTAEPIQMVDDHSSVTAQGVLGSFGTALASSGNRSLFGRAQKMLIFSPEHANKAAKAGFDKKLVREFLYEVYRVPVHAFPPESRERWRQRWRMFYGENVNEMATVPVVEDKEDIFIVVHGAAGPHSLFVPGIIGHRSVTRKIE